MVSEETILSSEKVERCPPPRPYARTLSLVTMQRRATVQLKRKVSAFFQRHGRSSTLATANLDLPVLLHRSAGIDYLTSVTDFSRNEVKAIYRGFREESPSGRMSIEEFMDMYGKLFPNAGTESFAKFVFGSFDLDKNGSLTFDGFLTLFSTLLRGTIEEKLRWVFKLYDTNKDGLLTQSDLERILLSVYSLNGGETQGDLSHDQVNEHVNFIFKKMDSSRKGAVTCAEFVHFCLNDSVTSTNIRQFTAMGKSGT
uniref:EF-hand domain-containing protein n=1 Tax=Trichuris muris TaxID=70415 RepID=A0A5S6QMK2_TRIMR